MPTFAIVRLLTIAGLMIGSAWSIRRYRAVGMLVSIFVGWGILVFVYSTWPAPPTPGDWDEDREEMPFMAPILMSLWCFPVWGVTELWRWLRRAKTNVHESA